MIRKIAVTGENRQELMGYDLHNFPWFYPILLPLELAHTFNTVLARLWAKAAPKKSGKS
jgi:hypothetical protein